MFKETPVVLKKPLLECKRNPCWSVKETPVGALKKPCWSLKETPVEEIPLCL